MKNMEEKSIPLVLLTGRMTSGYVWKYQKQYFEKSREVLIPVNYFGDKSVKEMAKRLETVLPSRYDLVGWSMGGFVALQLVLSVPERVRNLVLISTSARADSPVRSRQRKIDDQKALQEGLSPEWCRQQLSQVANLTAVDPEFVDSLCEKNAQLTARHLINQTRACSGRPDVRHSLPGIRAPLLVIAGAGDRVIVPSHQIEIAELVPASRIDILQDATHCAPFESSCKVNHLIEEFLQGR